MYKILENLEQGSDEWLEFRRTHITATDAGKIMEEVPSSWGTPYTCWRDKIMKPKIFINENMKLGTELEPIARKVYSQTKGKEYFSFVVKSLKHPFLMASLDGLTKDGLHAVEFKCGAAAAAAASEGIVKPYYIPQLQHTMNVLGHDFMDYCTYWNNELICLTVERDQNYIDLLVEKEMEFYNCLINMIEPRQTLDILYDEVSFEAICTKRSLEKALVQKKELEKHIQKYKDDLLEIANDRDIRVENLEIRKKTRIGSVKYKNIPELVNVDLNKYRNDPTVYYDFRMKTP